MNGGKYRTHIVSLETQFLCLGLFEYARQLST